MINNAKPLHQMTREEFNYHCFTLSGIKPPRYDAPMKERAEYQKVIKIQYDLIMQEIEKRKKAGIWKLD